MLPFMPNARIINLPTSIEALERRSLLSATPIDPATAIPFDRVIIDDDPGTTPVIKVLADVNGDGKRDAVIGFETAAGGNGGVFWYEFPSSGNAHDAWTRHAIIDHGDAYEAAAPVDL